MRFFPNPGGGRVLPMWMLAIAFLIIPTGRADPQGLPPGLVGWWQAEGNGLDRLGTNPGIPMDGLGYAPGVTGQAFDFDGRRGTVRIPASETLDLGKGDGFTLEAWVKPSDVGRGHPVFEWSQPVGGAPYGVHLWVGHPSRPEGYFYANIVDTKGDWHVIDSTELRIRPDVFQHLVVTYDKCSGLARLFLDGQQVNEASLGRFTPQTSYDLFLGERPPGDINSLRYWGLVDEIRIYNRALTPNEVSSVYRSR